jgi:alpha-glucosidase
MNWIRNTACLLTLFAPVSFAQTPSAKPRPAPDVPVGWHTMGRAASVSKLPNGVEVSTLTSKVRITALNDGVFRVQIAPRGGFPPDNSFAVLPEALQSMKPQSAVRITDAVGAVEVSSSLATARIEKTSMRVIFLDGDRKVIVEDDPRRPVMWNSARVSTRGMEKAFVEPQNAGNKAATAFRISKSMPEDEHYFGLGDKAGPLDHRNQAFTMWNTDAFGWQESTDPLYKTIPFFVALRGGKSYGIFLDNTFRSSFDFGKAERDTYSFGADDGAIDYYFFYGPAPKQVILQYTALTGRTPLPALWTLGYQQCRYSYYPEARVREVAQTFRDKQIPLDAIYLDIDYQQENRPFTIDRQKFPNFEGMVADLAKQGTKTIAITDMHMWAGDYPPYNTGLAGDHFVHNPDGSVYVGKVWPGDSVFPDFTRGAATREWWGSLYKDFVDKGVKGFWNDMNEPAVFERPNNDKTMPLDIVHRVAMPDGSERKADHREIHNVYGMQNVRATYEGMLRLRPELRPFVLTRAAYAGAQRYAATWTGDNSSSWNHLRLSLPTLMNMGISGYANVGDDIGGFWGSPAPELLTRWMEIGAFNPVYRNHTVKGSADQEPWVHGPEQEAIRKRYVELRYRLMPYTYSAFEENARTGVPVMRALFLEYPADRTEVVTSSSEYLYGRDLLITPKVYEFNEEYEVEMPRGTWFNYWTGVRQEGGKQVHVTSPIETLPVWVREGAIIPQMPVVQSLDAPPSGPLELRVYAPAAGSTAECNGSLYWDDGLTFAYKKGEFVREDFSCRSDAKGVTIHARQQGSYAPWWKAVTMQVFGLGRAPAHVMAGGKEVAGQFDAATGSVTFSLDAESMKESIEISYPQ